jgi:hypothetical protein
MRKKVSMLTSIVFAIISFGVSPTYAVDQRVIDVVEVSWPGASAPIGDVSTVAKVIDTEVKSNWINFTTMYGDTKDRSISFKSDKLLVQPILLASKMACQGSAASEFMNSIRPEAYKRLGIADYSRRYLVVVAPEAGCVWSGRARMGDPKSVSGTLILHDSASGFVISHELGHTFGLGHSNFLRCGNGANDGAWSDTCEAVEYGGTIDVMGNVDTTSPLSTYHQWRMGYLDDSQIKQVWQSEVVNLAPSDFANGIKAIFVRDGGSSYWIEYRRKINDVGYKPGLAIYRLDPPPDSYVISANPDDAQEDSGLLLRADVWMLNLDTYQYRDAQSLGGSMTASSATTFSGNVSFSAVANRTGVTVTVKKKLDRTAPPTPVLLSVDQWNSPGTEILSNGFEDLDTAITGFEAQINGVVQVLSASDTQGWSPTYLSPFVSSKTLYRRDLPEGSYTLSVRAIDVVGNKSNWSWPVKVNVDQTHPVVLNEFVLSAASYNEVSIAWSGATDAGSGICQVNVADEDGLILQSSTVENVPTFKLANGDNLIGSAQIFDCDGNGQSADLSITNTFTAATKSTRVGKLISARNMFGAGSLKCLGECSILMRASGKINVVLGSGAANVLVGGKIVAAVSADQEQSVGISTMIDVGTKRKSVQITGSNYVLVGLASVTTSLGALKAIEQTTEFSDPSILDEKQKKLAKLGLRPADFSQEWSVLPLTGGTKLDDATLEFCNGKFFSEKDRVERRQVAANKAGSKLSFVSTEVVRYSSALAANNAQKELTRALSQCQSNKGYKDAAGTLVAYDFKAIKNIPAGVMPQGNRTFIHAVINSGSRSGSLLAFYQFSGEVFTGLYVRAADSFNDAQVAKWLRVAAIMASRLQQR